MPRLIESLALLLLASLFVYLCISVEFIQDDAFITFRYVDNFVNGNGLVFNPGEYVEGYTSFLWVMILSVPAYFNLDYITIAQILSVTFGILILPVTYFLSARLRIRNSGRLTKFLFNLLPVGMLALTGGFHYWSISAMETSFFVFIVLLSILFYLRNPGGSAYILFLMLASLTRPEGFLFTLIILSHYSYTRQSSLNKLFNPTFVKKLLIFYILPVGIYLTFRFIYYGHLLPNTFFAKTGFGSFYLERGTDYLYDTFSSYFYYGLMLLLPLLLFFRKEIRNQTGLYYILVGTLFVGLIIIGGDVLPLHRFVLPVLPLVYIMFSKVLELLIAKIHKPFMRISLTLLSVVAILLTSAEIYKLELPRINSLRGFETGLVKKMKIYADWINSKAETDTTTVCLSTIGAFSYYTDAEVIDLIGLTDEYIAHNPEEVPGIAGNIDVAWKERRYNVDYVMRRLPDFIIIPAGAKPSAYPESALFTRLRFVKGYYPQLIYSEQLGQYLPVFTKKVNADSIPNKPLECDVAFINHYIRAQNDLLSYLRTRDEYLIGSIEDHCETITKICPDFETYAVTVLGYAYYHSGQMEKAIDCFKKAVELDEYNCFASIYLFNIYSELGDNSARQKYLLLLKKFSPDALPNLFSEL